MHPDLIAAITILWQGMLGIFCVLGFIAILVHLLTKITQSPNKK